LQQEKHTQDQIREQGQEAGTRNVLTTSISSRFGLSAQLLRGLVFEDSHHSSRSHGGGVR
jgi:hypothetical protein